MVRSGQARTNRREGVKLLCHNGLESELHSAPLERSRKEREKVMAAERGQNLQDTFLNYVRKNKVPLTIFLVNGVKLQGVVTWFDNFCVLLRRDGHSQLVYKHAISTIMPGHPIQMFEPTEETGAEGK
jgi:host factor-I protein